MKNSHKGSNSSRSNTGVSSLKQPILNTLNKQNISSKISDTISTISQNFSEEDIQEIEILQKLFFHYSLNESYLSAHQYFKFIKDTKLLSSEFNEHTSKKIFNASSKQLNKIPFNSFCEIMVEIAELKYINHFVGDQTIALHNLFSNYLIPLLNSLQSSDKIISSKWDSLISKLTSAEVFNVILEYSCELRELYQIYFIDNYNIESDPDLILKKNEKSLLQFSKDYAILPKYSTLVKLKEIFYTTTIILSDSLIESMRDFPEENEGIVFTFYHFIACIFLLSENNKLNKTNKPGEIALMRELIENLIKKCQHDHVSSAFIKRTIEHNNYSKDSTLNQTKRKCYYMPMSDNAPISSNSKSKCDIKPTKKDSNLIKTVDELVNTIISNYSDFLLMIYKYYCELYHDGKYSIFINQKGFIHFIKNLELSRDSVDTVSDCPTNETILSLSNNPKDRIRLITSSLIDTIFNKYSCFSSSKKHINFNLFVRIVLLICHKLSKMTIKYKPLKDEDFPVETFLSSKNQKGEYHLNTFILFIENYLYPLYNQIKPFFDDIKQRMDGIQVIYQDSTFELFYNEIKDILIPVLATYSKEYNQLSESKDIQLTFDQYIDSLSNMDLFPELINKSNLMKLSILSINDFDHNIIIRGQPIPSISCEYCLVILLLVCIGTRVVANSIDYHLNIAFFIQKIMKSKGLNRYISETLNNKVMNELMKIFHKYDKYHNNDNYNNRKSFFDLVKK